MLRRHSRARRICNRISCRFPVLDPHRTMFERRLIFRLHVLQTILHRSFDCWNPPSDVAFQLVSDRTNSGNDPRSVPRRFVVQGRISKHDLQRVHQSWLGHGLLLRDLLVDRSQIFRGRTHSGNEDRASRDTSSRLFCRRKEANRGSNTAPTFCSGYPLCITTWWAVNHPLIPCHTPTMGGHYLHVLVRHALLLYPRILGGKLARLRCYDFHPQLVPLYSREFHSTGRNHCIPILPCEYAVRASYSRSASTRLRDWVGSVWAFGLHFASRHWQSRVWFTIRLLVVRRSRFQSRYDCDAQSAEQAAPS